jgi:CheY-like chemotaxis protein
MMRTVFEELGFNGMVLFANYGDLLNFLETDNLDWVIATVDPEQPFMIVSILELLLETPSLRHIKISLMADVESNEGLIANCFEKGLLSIHSDTPTQASIAKDFGNLISILKVKNNNRQDISYLYLRSFLDQAGHHQDRVKFERNLLKLHPGDSKKVLSIAEALFLNGEQKSGEMALRHAVLLDPKIENRVKRLMKLYVKSFEQKLATGHFESMSIDTIVVVDPDTDMLFFVKETLAKIGIKNIHTFDSGISALAQLEKGPEPDLIISEWRIPDLSAPQLIQNLRFNGFVRVPIIITSSLVDSSAKQLIMELSVDEIVPKPFNHNILVSALVNVLQKNRLPADQTTLERNILRLLESDKIGESTRLLRLFMSDQRFEPVSKLRVRCYFEYYRGDFNKAKELGLQSLKLDNQNVKILNLLGKIYLRQNDTSNALKFFDSAHKLVPGNMSRLLVLSDLNADLGDTEKSKQYLSEVRTSHPNSQRLKEAETILHIKSGQVDQASSMINELNSISSVISSMNNRAVGLARIGRYEECLKLYSDTSSVIKKVNPFYYNTVRYNIALAHARFGELTKTLEVLQKIKLSDDPQLKKKILGLTSHIHYSLKTGEPLQINENCHDDTLNEPLESEGHEINAINSSYRTDNLDELLKSLEATVGEHCGFGLYVSSQTKSLAINAQERTKLKHKKRSRKPIIKTSH